MGTLFSQSPRTSFRVSKDDLDDFLETAMKLAHKHKLKVWEVIQAKEVLELERQNDLRHNNGDIFDEQMAGLGEILQTMALSGKKIK